MIRMNCDHRSINENNLALSLYSLYFNCYAQSIHNMLIITLSLCPDKKILVPIEKIDSPLSEKATLIDERRGKVLAMLETRSRLLWT